MDWKQNLLHLEQSPYLLQHKDNPVWWQAWSPESLTIAQQNNRLLIISIGYSACHWCHVMEHESFADQEVAAVMNARYLSIKVDREERPDIDHRYMQAAMLTSRQGGWPLNAIALPDGRPVFAGTYFPKERWLVILNHFHRMWVEQPDKMIEAAEHLMQGMVRLDAPPQADTKPLPSLDAIHGWKQQMYEKLDPEWGGPDRVPRFPMPAIALCFLADEQALGNRIHTWLMRMVAGGIHDHLGGGFARYSTDGEWLAPHFEKMLYDNGQLLEVFALAYKKDPNPLWKWAAEGILSWANREMRSPDGRFMAALDADSEGEEGLFYTWPPEEIKALPPEAFEAFTRHYEWSTEGNFEGRLILWNPKGRQHAPDQADQAWMKLLWQKREQRPRPATDHKILLGWNALMARGMALWALSSETNDKLLEQLNNCMEALWQHHAQNEGTQWWRLGKDHGRAIPAFLEDVAAMGLAMTAAAQALNKPLWWQRAQILAQSMIDTFSMPEGALLSDLSEPDPITGSRPLETGDNVIPSANSMAARFFLELGHACGQTQWIERAEAMAQAMHERVKTDPFWHSGWVLLFEHLARPVPVLKYGAQARAKAMQIWREAPLSPLLVPENSLEPDQMMLCIGTQCLMAETEKAPILAAMAR
jgi:hypothetical protein